MISTPTSNPPATFTLIDQADLPLQNGVGYLYQHQSGARVLSVVCPDDNKVFGINFRTPPSDHTGLPHILEHSVLCGSRNYPVKEPFKELLKTSLQTFLNAFTYPDRTCYPVASRNLKDFYNLMDVYLDAVFHPRLTPAVLGQEGWRLQWRPDGALEFQGVVFNEMKGVYASADSRWEEAVQRGLYPDTAYRFDYGGDPACIPQLTFDDFLAFHQSHYHPANAFVWFYGNDDPAERLHRLDAALQELPAGTPPEDVALQPVWNATRRHESSYPAAEHGDEGIFVSLNWLLPGTCLDLEQNLLAGMTSYLLFRNPASPLRVALLDSNLGEDILGNGVANHLRQPHACFGLRGVEPGDEDRVFKLIRTTLKSIVREGFRPDLIEGGFNSTEFYLREQNTGGTPRGLVAMLSALNVWINGGNPLQALQSPERIARLKRRFQEDPACFTEWIRTHLLENPAQTEVIVRPDPQLASVELAGEATRIAAIQQEFLQNPEAETKARTLSEAVDAFQNIPDSPEALDTLPRLALADVQSFPPEAVIETHSTHGVDFLATHLPSAGILYLNLVFDIRDLPTRDLALLSLYGRCLTELGNAHHDHLAFNEKVSCHMGGLHSQIETSDNYHPGEITGVFVLRAKCLADQREATGGLIRDMLQSPRLGPADRVMQMVLEEKANEESNLIHNGSRVVTLRLNAAFSAAERASEEMGGIAYLEALRAWESTPPAEIVKRLQDLHTRLMVRGRLQVHLAGDESVVAAARDLPKLFQEALPEGGMSTENDWTPLAALHREGLVMPSPVNFVGLATRLPHTPDIPEGSVAVATRLLRNDYLWEQVRMRGGAYGASCAYDRINHTLSFSSYRDPHVLQTLEIYKQAAAWLQQPHLDAHALEQLKIGTLGALHRARHAESAAYHSLYRHLVHHDEHMRRQYWEDVIHTEPRHLQAFGQALGEALSMEVRLCILGSKSKLTLPGLSLDLRHVMG